MPNPLLPYNRNGVLFPRKINGNYYLLSRPSDTGHTPFGDIYISESPDLIYWGKHKHVMGKGGHGWWQGTKIGAGPIPIETTEGWLLFYHGVSNTCNGFVYSFGAVILDLENPNKVLYRTRDYLLTPKRIMKQQVLYRMWFFHALIYMTQKPKDRNLLRCCRYLYSHCICSSK